MIRLVVRNRNIRKIVGLKWNNTHMLNEINKDPKFEEFKKLLNEQSNEIRIIKTRLGDYNNILKEESKDLCNKNITCEINRINQKITHVDKQIHEIKKDIWVNQCIVQFVLGIILVSTWTK